MFAKYLLFTYATCTVFNITVVYFSKSMSLPAMYTIIHHFPANLLLSSDLSSYILNLGNLLFMYTTFFIISLLACILFIIVLNFTVNIVTCWHVYLFLYCDLGQYAISFIDFLSVNIVVQFLTVSMVFSCYSVVQDIVFYSSCSLVRSLAGNCF